MEMANELLAAVSVCTVVRGVGCMTEWGCSRRQRPLSLLSNESPSREFTPVLHICSLIRTPLLCVAKSPQHVDSEQKSTFRDLNSHCIFTPAVHSLPPGGLGADYSHSHGNRFLSSGHLSDSSGHPAHSQISARIGKLQEESRRFCSRPPLHRLLPFGTNPQCDGL